MYIHMYIYTCDEYIWESLGEWCPHGQWTRHGRRLQCGTGKVPVWFVFSSCWSVHKHPGSSPYPLRTQLLG